MERISGRIRVDLFKGNLAGKKSEQGRAVFIADGVRVEGRREWHRVLGVSESMSSLREKVSQLLDETAVIEVEVGEIGDAPVITFQVGDEVYIVSEKVGRQDLAEFNSS